MVKRATRQMESVVKAASQDMKPVNCAILCAGQEHGALVA